MSNKIRYIHLTGIVILLSYHFISCGPYVYAKEKLKENYEKVYSEILKELSQDIPPKNVLKKHHGSDKMKISKKTSGLYFIKVPVIRLTRELIVIINRENNKIIEVSNPYLVISQSAKRIAEKEIPKIPFAKMEQNIMKYFKLFIARDSIKAKEIIGKIKISTMSNGDTVGRWKRMYKNYEYYNDMIDVTVSSIDGKLLFYLNTFLSDPPDNIEINIREFSKVFHRK